MQKKKGSTRLIRKARYVYARFLEEQTLFYIWWFRSRRDIFSEYCLLDESMLGELTTTSKINSTLAALALKNV